MLFRSGEKDGEEVRGEERRGEKDGEEVRGEERRGGNERQGEPGEVSCECGATQHPVNLSPAVVMGTGVECVSVCSLRHTGQAGR